MTAKRQSRNSGGRPPTLKDVAQLAEVSSATVSLVLNQARGVEGIPPETQGRVLAAARQLSYRPNLLARSLRSQHSSTVAVLVDDFSGYSAALMRGAEERLFGLEYANFFANHHARGELIDHYLRFFEDHQVAGFLLISTRLVAPPELPAVMVSGSAEPEGVTHVLVDHDKAAYEALSHLIELGHERIAFFRGNPENVDTEARWRGIVENARRLDIEIDEALVRTLRREHPDSRLTMEDGYREGAELARSLLDSHQPFSALFTFNDVSAIGAMRAFVDAGLRVPEEISVIGFDDIETAAFTNPSLTTVKQPLRRMGRIAAQELASLIAGDAQPHIVTIEPELIVRDSTGPASSS